jgi:predicted XRE-type DNA-binding protein
LVEAALCCGLISGIAQAHFGFPGLPFGRWLRLSKNPGASRTAAAFADLGLRNPEQEVTKAEVTLRIYRIIERRGMTQMEAAKAPGVKQPHVSLSCAIARDVFRSGVSWNS